MGRYEFDDLATESACERCGIDLEDEHWVRLKACHEGASSDRYCDSEMRVCVDCLTAIGMLEIEMETSDDEESGGLRDRTKPIRGMGR